MRIRYFLVYVFIYMYSCACIYIFLGHAVCVRSHLSKFLLNIIMVLPVRTSYIFV